MSNEQAIWDGVFQLIGNPYGVAGLLGNLQAESGFIPTALESTGRKALGMTGEEYTKAVDKGTYQNFVSDGYGYGLQQLTYKDHKQGLLDFARRKKKSIGDLGLQIEYLNIDLQAFSSVLHTLWRATSVKEASDDVLLRYEKPADMSDKAKARRAELGQIVFDKLADKRWVEWFMESKVRKTLEAAKSKLGCPYVYGARGPNSFDCRGYTYWSLLQAGIRIDGAGATSQWNDNGNWLCKGKTDDMPDVMCCVFKYDGTEKMKHTGLHIGHGQIMHCSSGGVQYGMMDTGWTHWAVPIGLYTGAEIKDAERMTIMPVLRKGATGEAVQELQEKLNKLGYDCGTADGVYGSKAIAAVKRFQADHDLAVDGVCGQLTWAAINNALDGGDPVPGPEPDLPDEPDLEVVMITRSEVEAVINTLKRWIS